MNFGSLTPELLTKVIVQRLFIDCIVYRAQYSPSKTSIQRVDKTIIILMSQNYYIAKIIILLHLYGTKMSGEIWWIVFMCLIQKTTRFPVVSSR